MAISDRSQDYFVETVTFGPPSLVVGDTLARFKVDLRTGDTGSVLFSN